MEISKSNNLSIAYLLLEYLRYFINLAVSTPYQVPFLHL